MPDAGLMGGIGSFAEGFLKGRAESRAQQAQDLEKQKYEFMKEHQPVLDALAKRGLSIQAFTAAAQAAGTYGSDVEEPLSKRTPDMWGDSAAAQPQPQPQAQPHDDESPFRSTVSIAQPSQPWGLLNYQPGDGLMPRMSPYSTLPSVTAQANPNAAIPNPPQNRNELPYTPPLMVRQARMAQLKQAQDEALKLKSQGGSADVVDDGHGGVTLANVRQGTKDSEEINNLRHAGRSAENAINDQYEGDKVIAKAHASQPYMAQMLDANKNPSPYSDGAMVLNAYKIRFPDQASDVNSVEDFKNSQSVDANWKATLSRALNGQFDQNTRDNLMRDAASSFNGYVSALKSQQPKYANKAKHAGVNASFILAEPAITKTDEETKALLAKIGPYIPPSKREGGGLMDSVLSSVAKFAEGTPTKSAPAAPQDPKISDYAKKYGLDYSHAAQILKARGYGK